MPDTTNRTTRPSTARDDAPMRHRCETCKAVDSHAEGCPENIPPDEHDLAFAELETGGFAVSLNGFWLPGSFPTQAEAEVAAGAAIARAEPSFSELIHQAADVRETLHYAVKGDLNASAEIRTEARRAVGIIGTLAARLMAEVSAPPAPPVTADELLAIIGTWLARDCDWGEFEKALDALVEAHS